MALNAKIKHVDVRPNGVLRFLRRFPKDVAQALGEGFLQVHIRNREGVAFHREYEAIMRDFERMVRQTREATTNGDTRPAFERWHEALLKAEGLVGETFGLDDDRGEGEVFARHMIAKGLSKRPDTDHLLVKALVNPEAAPPEATLRDAANRYAADKGIKGDKDAEVRFERIMRRLEQALGKLEKVTMPSLRREHGRKFMETLLSSRKSNGQPLALATCKREAVIVEAVVTHGLTEFDLAATVSNPFIKLPWPEEGKTAVDKKLPLPDALVESVKVKLEAGKTNELPLLWRLLAGTGMRLNEAAGLLPDDVVLDAAVPHVLVRTNTVRRLKTASSVRSVPLVGDALAAIQEALKVAPVSDPIFPRYARHRGADAASQALMKTVKGLTDDTRFTVHGLRHRASDKLREAGAPEGVRFGFLGHAHQSVAETTYGGREARLREFAKWAEKAGL